MKILSLILFCGAVLLTLATPGFSHDCRVRDAYLRGDYEGGCDERTEMAQGKGEAKGADTYVGEFVKGKPDGKGVYTCEKGGAPGRKFQGGQSPWPRGLRERQGCALRGTIRQRQARGIEDCRLSVNAVARLLLSKIDTPPGSTAGRFDRIKPG